MKSILASSFWFLVFGYRLSVDRLLSIRMGTFIDPADQKRPFLGGHVGFVGQWHHIRADLEAHFVQSADNLFGGGEHQSCRRGGKALIKRFGRMAEDAAPFDNATRFGKCN